MLHQFLTGVSQRHYGSHEHDSVLERDSWSCEIDIPYCHRLEALSVKTRIVTWTNKCKECEECMICSKAGLSTRKNWTTEEKNPGTSVKKWILIKSKEITVQEIRLLDRHKTHRSVPATSERDSHRMNFGPYWDWWEFCGCRCGLNEESVKYQEKKLLFHGKGQALSSIMEGMTSQMFTPCRLMLPGFDSGTRDAADS